MIYKEKPEDFESATEIVGAFIEHDGKILLLSRCLDKAYGGSWGAPGGKVDKTDNSLLDATVREVFEETGILFKPEDLSLVETFFVQYPEKNFIYHKYHVRVDEKREIILSESEHNDFVWVTPQEALKLPLILHEDFCIIDFYKLN